MTLIIDAGIGNIKVSADNIKLQELIEALKAKIESTTPDHVIKLLS
jgi:hypothetical protein